MSEPVPHLNTSVIPEVPAGTVLRLAPGEWSHCRAVPVGSRFEVTVCRTHPAVTRQDGAGLWVWLAGHEHPSCTWEHVEPHPPCVQLMVRVDVLRREVGS